MAKELLVNVSRGEEVRVALVEEGRLEEIYLERDNAASNVGNIYLGKVTNVEGSIQAAFVDFGYGRNGFLHVQDLHPDYFPEGGKWDRMSERVGKKIGRRDRPPIQDCLRRGDHIVVQIIKEGIGTKGPTLTSYPSIPGRMLVAMPGVGQMGVSKNIEDEKERRRLRKILDTFEPPEDVGFIIRTAGEGKTKADVERDFKYLSRLWQDIVKQRKTSKPPALLYSEGDLVTRTVRDVYSSDVDRIVVDDVQTALQIKQFFKLLMPRTKVDVQLYEGKVPLFHAAGIEHEIETMFSRNVPIGNGGSLVIDTTEAVVAIDVNSGKFREHGDAEETAFRMDLEAADEICRQLRLRDLGGLVIVDFIDLRYSRHREALFDRLTENFKRDRAKSRHLAMSEFGIVEITRQRMRPDLKKSVFMPCPWSNGTGYIKTPESMALDVMRKVGVAAADNRVNRVHVRLYPTAALHILNHKRSALADLESRSGKSIQIATDESLAADAVELDLFDDRDMPVQVAALRVIEAEAPDQGHKRRRGGRRRRGRTDKQNEGPPEAELDDIGLIDLDDIVSIGDMSAEELSDLAREAADPFDDEDVADRSIPSALAGADEDDADDEEDEAPRRGRRRRRRGGRGSDDAEVSKRSSDNGDVPALHADSDEEDEQPRGRRRRRRRGRRDEDEAAEEAVATETAADDEASDEAPAEDREPSAGRSRRRRRRRGTRDEDREDRAEPVAEVEALDADDDEADRDPDPEPAAERSGKGRRRRRRGRGRDEEHVEPEASSEQSEPEPEAAEDEDDAEPVQEPVAERPGKGRRRRRRRGRSADETPESDASADEVTADEPAEAATEDAVEEPASERPGKGRRRRRRRSRSSEAADAPAAAEDDADEVETELVEAVEPAIEAEDEPELESAEEPAADEPAEPAEAERPARRRRNRGRVVKSRPIVVPAAAPKPAAVVEAAEPEPQPEPEAATPKKAAKKAAKRTAKKTAKKAAKSPKKAAKKAAKTAKKATKRAKASKTASTEDDA